MEIEAKYAVPNRRVYRALARLRSLAGYTLVPKGTTLVHDAYYDTADGRFLAAGYACRLRSRDGGLLLTLKGLGGAEGAIHRRDEQEAVLPAWSANPEEWPEGQARSTAIALAGGAQLRPLFEMDQRRALSEVRDGDRQVAELSLDAVRAQVGRRPTTCYEIEVELAPSGTEADLAAVAGALATEWGLVPEPRSKFERALEALRRSGMAVPHLSGAERALLEALRAGTDRHLAQRAAIVLAWDEGLPTAEIAAQAGLSRGRVRYWLRRFRAERTGLFRGVGGAEEGAEAQPEAAAEAAPGPVPPAEEGPAAPPSGRKAATRPRKGRKKARGLPTVVEFCEQHGVDMEHARFVATQAAFLFDALRPIHKLPRKRRRLLQQAALVNTVGQAEDPERPYQAGRDLILAQPLHDVSTSDRLALACIAAFNRNKVRPEREPTMAALDAKLRPQVLLLTALLRIAEALDFSRTQSSEIQSLDGVEAERCEVVVVGPSAEMDALQASGRADLWYRLIGQELVFSAAKPEPMAVPGEQPVGAEAAPAAPAEGAVAAPGPEILPIAPDDPMPEAGRKVLYQHFTRMVANEPGTRLGQDIEALHDMRVATRRMRAAFRLFEPYFEEQVLAPFGKGLRRTGRILGAVRDLDVLLDKANAYREGLPPEEQASLDPLLLHWQTRREVARREMLEYLDSKAYARFRADFEAFLTTPGAGALPPPGDGPTPYQVRHVVPHLVLARYGAVRAYETALPDAPLTTYHMLRIECKWLRYALEFFRDVLGPEAPGLIKQVVAMQDLLGELQDAHVAEGLLAEFLSHYAGKRKKGGGPGALPGVEAYLAAQQAAQQELLARFPEPWSRLTGPEFRRELAAAVAAL